MAALIPLVVNVLGGLASAALPILGRVVGGAFSGGVKAVEDELRPSNAVKERNERVDNRNFRPRYRENLGIPNEIVEEADEQQFRRKVKRSGVRRMKISNRRDFPPAY